MHLTILALPLALRYYIDDNKKRKRQSQMDYRRRFDSNASGNYLVCFRQFCAESV
jgi:hypothetical protein